MRIRIIPSALKETRWYEYAARFFFGGLITAVAGVISKKYGPVLGGLFLAFPAIFPASATLIEKHERQRKERHGLHGTKRGKKAASVDAAGAALGSLGLVGFGAIAWWLAPQVTAWLMLSLATLVWAGVSCIAWIIRKRI